MTQSDVVARFDRGLTSVDDAELIQRVRQDDGEALGELYRRHAPSAVRAARAFTGSAHDADDVVSEVFSAVWRAIRNGRGPSDRFEPYLIAAVKNRSRMLWFNGFDHTGLDDQVAAPTPVDTVAADRGPDLAAKAFVALNPREREMLWLTAVEGHSSVEAGEEMSLTRRAAAILKFRAKRSFAEAYLSQYAAAAGRRQSCRTLSPKLSSYVRGSCRKRARVEVETHLAICASCTSLVEALADVNTTFRNAGLPVVAGLVASGVTRLSWFRRVVASLHRISLLKPALYVTAGGLVTVLPAAALFGTDRDVPQPDARVIEDEARRPAPDATQKRIREVIVESGDTPAAGSQSRSRPRVADTDAEGISLQDTPAVATAPVIVETSTPPTTAPPPPTRPPVATVGQQVAATPPPAAPGTTSPPTPPRSTTPTSAPELVSLGAQVDGPLGVAAAVAVDDSSIAADLAVAVDELSIDGAVDVAVDEPAIDASVSATVPTPVGVVAADVDATIDLESASVDVSATVPALTVGDVEVLPEIPIDIELVLPMLGLGEPPTGSVPAE